MSVAEFKKFSKNDESGAQMGMKRLDEKAWWK